MHCYKENVVNKIQLSLAAAAVALLTTGCGATEEAAPVMTSTQTAAPTSEAVQVALPTAEELNQILMLAADPEAPIEEKVRTVQGGETAPELFEVMTAAKIESGANFQVVQPILPGYTNESLLATVNVMLPDREAELAENVEFVFEDGTWKLSQSWACTLITNTVTPEQVPAMCGASVPPAQPAGEAATPAQPAGEAATPAQPAGEAATPAQPAGAAVPPALPADGAKPPQPLVEDVTPAQSAG